MRTLHEQAAATSRRSVLAGTSHNTHTTCTYPSHPPVKVAKQGKVVRTSFATALAVGFAVQIVVFSLCFVTELITDAAQSFFLSGLVAMTAFCLSLAWSKGIR